MKNRNEKKMTYDKAFIIDMDGVINKGKSLIPGACEFIDRLKNGKFTIKLSL